MNELSTNAKQFCAIRHGLEMIYDDYARSFGISYTTLFTLNAIHQFKDCTQKIICEHTMIPKQTINNVIKKLISQGYVQLTESSKNHKIKIISFTEEGKEYAGPILAPVLKAENMAMEELSAFQQDELLKALKLYDFAFRKAMASKKGDFYD